MNLNTFITLLENISKLQLEHLPKQWVDLIWREGFPTPIEIPPEYELQVNLDCTELLKDTRDLLQRWIEEDMDVDTPGPSSRDSLVARKSWNGLANEINHRALLCLLSSFISLYKPKNYSESEVYTNRRAVEAARLYFMLISVEGSHIFNVFQGVVYHQCLEIFKSLASFNRQQSRPAQRGRGRGRRNVQDDDDDDDEDMENGHSQNRGPNSNREDILKNCTVLMDDLYYSLTKFSLLIDEGSLNQTIQTMIQVAGVERKESALHMYSRSRPATTYLAFKAYSVLNLICSPTHGTTSETCKQIMRNLLPCMLIYENNALNNVTHEAVVVKDHSINFIISLLKSLKEEAYDSVYTLVEHICFKVPDKADIRTKYIDIVIDIVNRFPYDLYNRAILFLSSLCMSDAVRHRSLGIEMVAKIATLAPREDATEYTLPSVATNTRTTGSNSPGSLSNSTDISPTEPSSDASPVTLRFLFALVVARCADVSPRIRIKSLSVLSNLLRSNDLFIKQIVEEIFIFREQEEVRDTYDFNKVFANRPREDMTLDDPLPTSGTIIKLIERLTQDARAFVRKNALHVVADICQVHERWITEERLGILINGCKDLSVANRKLMAQCLTDLLHKKPENDMLISAWVSGVVPLFAENEVKSQEKVLELAASVILETLVPLDRMQSVKDKLPWRVIALILKRDMRKLYKHACQQWSLKGYIKDSLIRCLQTHIGSENNLSAWYFLVCISEFQDLPNPESVLNYFYESVFNKTQINELESEFVLQTLVLCWRKLKPVQIAKLCQNLKSALEQFEVPLPLVSGSLEIIQLNNRDTIKEWVEPILLDCRERTKVRVKKVVLEECYSDPLLCRYIFMIGELSLIVPDMIDLETVNALANLIDLANIDEERLEKSLPHFGYVQAVTVATLGKLCLQNQFTAKAVVPILGALVSAKAPSGIKNNANIALTDLCIRFSSLVEPYFGDMFVCLKDPDPVVRRNTLNLITMLIQEQYLKLKPHIFIYLVTMLLDPSSEIRDFTSSFIVNSLLTKDPTIVHNYFVPGVFFLNGHEGSSRDQISPQERAIFSLVGEQNKLARQELYIFLLQNMDDVLKFKTKYRICVDILYLIVEDKISIRGPKGEQEVGVILLKDSLYILGCEDIKMTMRKACKDGGPEEDEDDVAQAVAFAKKNVMKQLYNSLSKKNLMDNIMPIFKRLRQKLDVEKSPLVNDLINCLREILKEFTKEQIEEILAIDPSLSAEVLHELRRHESEEGTSNQSQDDPLSSPRDPVMEQMAQVAKRLSCTVMLHGPESISTEDAQMEDVEPFVPVGRLSQGVNSTPVKAGKTLPTPRNSHSPKVNGHSPSVTSEPEQIVSRGKRNGRSHRSSSVMSDRSDISTSISSLSSQASSSSGSTKSRRRKR